LSSSFTIIKRKKNKEGKIIEIKIRDGKIGKRERETLLQKAMMAFDNIYVVAKSYGANNKNRKEKKKRNDTQQDKRTQLMLLKSRVFFQHY
jgi:ABC-type sugar transport system substrate-binding protein